MAVCALIAAADGTADASEPARFVGLIGSNDVLSIFPAMDLRNDFDHFCNKLENDSTSASSRQSSDRQA
jgi:tellurite resistance protein TerB